MNNTALQLFNWIYSQNKNKIDGEEISRELCRENWEQFGEEIIKRTLNHNGCTSYAKFRQICKHYLANKKEVC